jgi:hypothetical protein
MRVFIGMLIVFASVSACTARNLLANGDVEGKFGDDGIAQGWADNSSWANLDVRYGRETVDPHGGAACQRVACTRLDYGAVQLIPQGGVPLKRGAIYRVRAWLRGDVGPVAVQLRQAPAPYRVYVEEGLRVSPRWQEASYFWTANVDDPQGRFMLRFAQPGTLWVDDLSVEEVTAEEAARVAPPAEAGNLVRNGGFDLGLANWLVNHGCDYWQEATLAVEMDGGNPCLKLSVPGGIGVTLSSEAAEVAVGRPLTIACRVRAEAAVQVLFTSGCCGARPTVTDKWQAVTATGKVGFQPRATDYVRFVVTGPAVLWVDDVELRQDGKAGGDGRFEAAMISERHPLALYHEGEDPRLRLLTSKPGVGKSPLVDWRIEDFWGSVRLSGRWSPGAGRQEKLVPADKLGRGWYRATVAWTEDGREQRNESAFVILPPADRRSPVKDSPFGAHFAVDPSGLALARAVGCRWLRLHPPNHTKWRVVEPDKKGEWKWRDEPIRIAREAGLELIGSLDRCPDWASSAPPGTPQGGFYTGIGAWVPRDWAEWENYVAETVRRYKDDIRIWEVWNEPNLGDWLIPREGQTHAQAYVELLQHTYPVVKREDPTATVIAGVVAGALTEKSPARQFTEEMIERGGLEFMDQFSFHDYLTKSVDEGSEPIEVWLAHLRGKLRAAGREVPILNSEGGYANPGTSLTYRPCPSNTISPDKMARWLIRQHVSQLALGVKQFFFYNFFLDGSPVIRDWEGFVEGDGQPRPNVAAYAAMTWLLDGATFERTERPRPSEDAWVHHFRTPRGPLAVAWTRSGTEADLSFRDAARAWDLMGAEKPVPATGQFRVTDAPVYVLLRAK